jgi:hypothetical protein
MSEPTETANNTCKTCENKEDDRGDKESGDFIFAGDDGIGV